MKILIVIDNDLYLRNFVLSGSFNKLPRQNVTLALSDAVIKLKHLIPKSFNTKTYLRNEQNKARVAVFNQISMRHLRDKSSTFAIKTTRYGGTFKDKFIFNLFSYPILYQIAKWILIKKLVKNSSLEQVIIETKPEIVLFPLSGYEGTGLELISLSKKHNYKTLFLTNGWDNLSSKGVFMMLPDYLGVWGPQALVDAINIQNMSFSKIFLLGCSRYENYFQKIQTKKKIFPFKYILFAGSTTAADEITPLKIFDDVLTKLKVKDIKIIYRPHPMRAPRKGYDFFEKKKYKNIVIDPQVEKDYYQDKIKGTESGAAQNFPDLNYYPELLKNSLFIISPLSSMLIEAAIFDVPALVLAHNDPDNPIPASLQAEWKHFEGATDIPGWFFAYNLKQIRGKFNDLVINLKDENTNKRLFKNILSNAIKRYLHHDDKLYADRLLEAIKIIDLKNKLKT